MGTEIILEDLDQYGPAMRSLNSLQRRLVMAYLNFPGYSATALALEAGYSASSAPSSGSTNLRDERVIAAINEEGSKRLRSGGAHAIGQLLTIAGSPTHKDQLKAIGMILDRTGFHAMSEHKVTVDDKRPQTKAEMIQALKNVMSELGGNAGIEKLTGVKTNILEGEFEEIEKPLTAEDL